MPAPKMQLDGISLNQPSYGYTSEVHTGIKWEKPGDNWLGFNTGMVHLRAEIGGVLLDETQIKALELSYLQNQTLVLSGAHGFYPFSPLVNPVDGTYSVQLREHVYSGVLKSPWKYSEVSLSMHLAHTPDAFTPESVVLQEGNMCFWDCAGGVNNRRLQGIREIDQPPDLELPSYYNSAVTQSGAVYSIVRNNAAYENSGFTSEIRITGSLAKINKLLSLLVNIGNAAFYILMDGVTYSSEPGADTQDPEYWLFGAREPARKYQAAITGPAVWFYAFRVKCISNPITVTHDNLRNFTVSLRLALVI